MTNANAIPVALDKIGRKIEVGDRIAFANSNIEGESFLVLAKVEGIRESPVDFGAAVLALKVEGWTSEYTERADGVILI